tara:strand:+ start:742 stop:1035 length:294 start_codon:yes stop_codon:yes gene_type:complete
MNSLFRKDSMLIGIVIGLVLPAIGYAIFYLGMDVADKFISARASENMQLFLIALNAVVMRQFMVKREQDNIGKGILMVTMAAALIHFIYYYSNWFTA